MLWPIQVQKWALFGFKSEQESVVPRTHYHATIAWNYLPQYCSRLSVEGSNDDIQYNNIFSNSVSRYRRRSSKFQAGLSKFAANIKPAFKIRFPAFTFKPFEKTWMKSTVSNAQNSHAIFAHKKHNQGTSWKKQTTMTIVFKYNNWIQEFFLCKSFGTRFGRP